MELKPKSRILVIRLSAIGDVARTLSAVTLLRRQYPQAYIAWVVEEKSSPILDGDPAIDEIILFPRMRYSRLIKNPFKWPQLIKDWVQFARKLKSYRFDVVFDFHGILKSGLISFFTGAKHRIGYTRPFVKEMNWLFSNIKIPLENSRLNRYDRNRELVSRWVTGSKSDPIPLFVSLQDQQRISLFLKQIEIEKGFKNPRKIVVLHPGASKGRKQWPSERFSELADKLIQNEKVVVILTWGPGEKELAEKVLGQVKRKESIVLSQELSLKQLAELASRADLFVSADSGPMHIAAAMGARQIALFGPTDPMVNNPNNPKATVVHHPNDEGIPSTMNQIEVEEVLHLSRLKLID